MTPGRTENGVKNRFNSLMKKWFKRHHYPTTTEEETIISELYKNLLAVQSSSPQDQKRREDPDIIANQQKQSNILTKKTVSIDELKKKQEFNLLFELLKADLDLGTINGNATIFSDQKKNIAFTHQTDIKNLEKICRKEEPVIIKKENVVYNEGNIGYQLNKMSMGINPAFTPIWMQQYMMNVMFQQAVFNNAMMSSLLKQEHK